MKKRNLNIDIIKSLALFLVIGVHFFLYNDYYTMEFSLGDTFFIIIRNICLSCVPLFIVTTGFLNRNKVWSKKYYLNILYVYGLYSLAMFILTFVYNGYTLNIHILKETNINILKYEYYGWYINMYVGLMLIAPLINIAFKNMSKKVQQHSVLNIILAISIPVTFTDLFTDVRYSILANILPNWWMWSWPLVYYMIGVYFAYNKEKIKRGNLIFLVTIIVGGLAYYSFNIHFEKITYGNIFSVLTVSLLFNIILNMEVSFGEASSKIIKFISSNTLPAYLLSRIVDTTVYPYLIEKIPDIHQRLLFFPITILFFVMTILMTVLFAFIVFIIKKVIRIIKSMAITA